MFIEMRGAWKRNGQEAFFEQIFMTLLVGHTEDWNY